MYTLQIKKGTRLARIALGASGRIVRDSRGDRCIVTSLVTAQELAKVFAESGLLA
jgi:hypothetical protein